VSILANRLILPHDVNGGLIYVPREIAVCPYCDDPTPLVARMAAWESDGKRRGVEIWKCSEIELECVSEPELFEDMTDAGDSEEWDEWINAHSYMPYVYMLPIEIRVSKWINSCYRFVM
jgi:hypothetical protein